MTPASTPLKWTVRLHDEFDEEFKGFTEDEQDWLLAAARALGIAGPRTGRPHVDALKGSRHDNMKELRYKSDDGRQVWRAAFAFDPNQQAIILCAAAKHGVAQKAFYKALVAKADRRFDVHLEGIAQSRSRGAVKKR